MPLHRSYRPLWLLPVLLAGCSSTMGSRFGGTPQSKSIAVVGERPLPASTGEPGGRVVADEEGPEPRRNPKTRISGRVVDEAGEPVPGATVRLADGGVKGGKEIRGVADRSGGFTLNGLRPGSTYLLVAEGEDGQGPLQGRAEARTAETGVEITLAAEDKKAPTTRRSARPPKAKPVSNREDVAEEADQAEPARVNHEDVSPAGDSPETLDPGPTPPTPAGRPKLSPPELGVGWKNSKATATNTPGRDAEDETASPDVSPGRRRAAPTPAPGDDEGAANPLPPAIDPDVEPARPADEAPARKARPRKPAAPKPESGDLELAPQASVGDGADRPRAVARGPRPISALMPDLDPGKPAPTLLAEADPVPKPDQATPAGPPDLPPVGAGPVATVAAGLPSPTASPPGPPAGTQDVAPPNPAPQPVFASQGPATRPAEGPASDDYNPFASIIPARFPPDQAVDHSRAARRGPSEARPAPDESAPAAEGPPKKKWGELAASDRPAVVVEPTKAAAPGAFGRKKRAPAEGRDPSIALCSYDTRLRKINDFCLPDLEGKPVRFQEFDADYVLLDFWGTWCGPCLDAIPHLVALQKKYGPDRLKVVGIACEEVPPEQRKAKVDEATRKFGINYPVLLSTMDGKPCPVQRALQIQAMPTMILVDRRGQVLWRNSGATEASENRLDRILALSLGRGDSARR